MNNPFHGKHMMTGKYLQGLVGFFALTLCFAAFAADPVGLKLNCPTGTKQVSTARGKTSDMVACVKSGEKEFIPHGPIVLLYPDGAKSSEGMAEDGSRTGLWTFYSKTGQRTGTAMFKRGSFHGDVVNFHDNGKVKTVEQYMDGLREGMAKEYSADGSLVKQTEYHNNREVSVK